MDRQHNCTKLALQESGRSHPSFVMLASRGLYPLDHSFWWNGLKEPPSNRLPLPPNKPEIDEKEVSLLVLTQDLTLWNVGPFVSIEILKPRITIIAEQIKTHLTTTELEAAENYWIKVIQATHFADSQQTLSNSSSLCNNILRVGQTSNYQSILHEKHSPT